MISFILTIAIAGFLVWLIVTYVPMLPIFKNVIVGVAVVGLILYALSFFGVWDGYATHYRPEHYR